MRQPDVSVRVAANAAPQLFFAHRGSSPGNGIAGWSPGNKSRYLRCPRRYPLRYLRYPFRYGAGACAGADAFSALDSGCFAGLAAICGSGCSSGVFHSITFCRSAAISVGTCLIPNMTYGSSSNTSPRCRMTRLDRVCSNKPRSTVAPRRSGRRHPTPCRRRLRLVVSTSSAPEIGAASVCPLKKCAACGKRVPFVFKSSPTAPASEHSAVGFFYRFCGRRRVARRASGSAPL